MSNGFLLATVLLSLALQGCNTASQRSVVATGTAYTYKTPHPDGTGKLYMGREIAHVMSAAGAAWLERSSRQAEEDAESAVAAMPLTSGSIIADIGAGTGYYSFRLAQTVPQGLVYAVEIQPAFVQSLQSRVQKEGHQNIKVITGSETSPNLPDASVDLVIMVDVYHELAYPGEMLQALHRALKPTGQLLLLEYRAEDPAIPIKELHKMSVKQAKKELEANGFRLAEKKDFLPIQHYLLFQKESN